MTAKATAFGRMIRKLRIDHRVVLKDMSDEIGVSSAYASAIELGNKNITDSFIQKIVSYFNLDEQGATELRKAADLSQPSLKVDLKGADDNDRELVVSFARKYHDLSSDRKRKLIELLDGD